ncbi:MAG: chromate transporter [Tenericutes bacterium HGW-Tenericutes-5]|nr:MAG: chromate transporter [Tenericutes bacterium HGW-Tenericutes-5]
MNRNMNVKWRTFLFDILMCSLSSYGGPEAHYGVFSSYLVKKKKYLTEEELTEMIGLYAIVPGPSSTQTITAIGYYVGGPVLAVLTFLVWALPAILTMSLIGVFFAVIDGNDGWKPLIEYLPAVAIAFIVYAAISLSRKVVKNKIDIILFILMLLLSLFLVKYSMWVVPVLLFSGGLGYVFFYKKDNFQERTETVFKPKWLILIFVIGIALLNEGLRIIFSNDWIMLYSSFYRYGYSVIGGGQIVIPLMIQDLVQSQTLISLNDFLSGYAIDQAIPGPLFSFAGFVSARSFARTGYSLLAGLVGAFSIFLPGILLVFFIFPLWHKTRNIPNMKSFLRGVGVTAAALIAMTAITSVYSLEIDWISYLVVGVSVLLLLSKKIPAPLIAIGIALLGFLV